MILPKFEKSVIGQKNIHLKTQKQRPNEKSVWSQEIMVNCDVICGANEKMVWCAFPRSLVQSQKVLGMILKME